MELLAIVEAEQEAERIVRAARERQERSLQQALVEREQTLEQLRPIDHLPLIIAPVRARTQQIRRAARMDDAVKRILEEVRAFS